VGLFDDAIREHLDLKRKRGADPRKVAELQREALGLHLGAGAGLDDMQISARRGRSYPDVVDWSDGHRLEARRSTLNHETVEIDMSEIVKTGQAELMVGAPKAYDWSAEDAIVDIADPKSEFEWVSPRHTRLRGAA
jgi:hypothetical protein